MNSRYPDPYGAREEPLAHTFARWLQTQATPETPILVSELYDIIHDVMLRSRRHLTAHQTKQALALSFKYVESMLEHPSQHWADIDTGEAMHLYTKEQMLADPTLEDMEAAAAGLTSPDWSELLK